MAVNVKGIDMAYINYSMSVNAANAYADGMKPKSKWTKADIIRGCEKAEISGDLLLLIKNAKASAVKRLLTYAEWHHTSKFYNDTDFYKVDLEWLEDVTAEKLAAFLAESDEPAVTEYRAVCRFLEWTGTRKHPKATEYEEEGIIKGKWFYRSNGSKKLVNANGFKIIRKI